MGVVELNQPNAGDAQQSQGLSIRSFVTSLILYGSICVVVLLFESAAYKRWYSQRFPNTNPPSLSLKWPPNVELAIRHHGFDGFFFIRFLHTMVKLFLPLTLIVTGTLLPLDIVADHSSTVTGLDRMTWSNLQGGEGAQDWAHAVVAATAVVYICYVLMGEIRVLVRIRQEYLPVFQPSSKILLVTDIPKERRSEEALAAAYAGFGGGPRKISVNQGPGRKLAQAIDTRHISAFLEFTDPAITYVLQQAVQDSRPMSMIPHAVVSENDVIRSSLSLPWWSRLIRKLLFEVLIVVLCIFWAVPIGLTGMLSQISYLNQKLGWVQNLLGSSRGMTWLGLIQGFFPPVSLSILMTLFPYVLVLLVQCQGHLTSSHVEISVHGYYFLFLYVQAFLVVTVASSLTTVFQEALDKPESVPSILATNIPKSSNYFYSYLLLECITQCAVTLSQLPQAAVRWLVARLRNQTPQVRWRLGMQSTRWGLMYPVFTNLASICIIFCIVAPLILPIGAAVFGVFSIMYSNKFIHRLSGKVETAGLLYWRTLQQLFVSIYTAELSVIGLFILRDARYPAIFLGFVFSMTGCFQYLIFQIYGPVIRYLPATHANHKTTNFPSSSSKSE